jgi:hypothetical protein
MAFGLRIYLTQNWFPILSVHKILSSGLGRHLQGFFLLLVLRSGTAHIWPKIFIRKMIVMGYAKTSPERLLPWWRDSIILGVRIRA